MTCISGRELWRRKSFHTLGSPFTDGHRGWAGGKLWSHGGERSSRGAEGKVERFPHRGLALTSTYQPERLVCSTAGMGGGWELRLGFRRSDSRERTGVSCLNTAWRGLVHHSKPGGSLGKSLDLPKRQETTVSGGTRRGDSEHCLNELQRWARATANSADTRDGHETLRLLFQPPRILLQAQVTIHTSPPGSLCSLPLPGSCDPGTTSLGEHMSRLRLLQCHAGLCCYRLALHSIPLPPPAWVSQSPLIRRSFNPLLSG